MQLGEMTPADFGEVISFWKTIEGVGLNESDTPECLAIFLERNPGLSLVVRDQRQVIGAVLCGHDGRRGYLHHLAVAPEQRGQGLGSRLVETCLTRLGALGILKCNIFVYNDNDPGTLFWRKTGWLDRGDLKIMQKVIPPASDVPLSLEAIR
jgi:putative acetyltransferase